MDLRKIAANIVAQQDIEDKIYFLVDDYNRQYKVEDTSHPSAPDTSKFRATSGGWVRTNKKDGRYVLEAGTSFPKTKELIDELKKIPGLDVFQWRTGTNYNTYAFKLNGEFLKG